MELLRDLFGVALSIGTIHAWVKQAAQRAAGTNQVRDLSGTQFDRTRLKTAVFRGLLALALCYPKRVETEPHPAIQSAVVWRGVAQANV